ncbi:MAG: sensor histidine kinase [Halanaeroarchaeum sp.]
MVGVVALGELPVSWLTPGRTVFTVVPLVAMLVAILLSVYSIGRHRNPAHLLLVAILALMSAHQVLEILGYVHAPSHISTLGEGFETVVNLLTAVAVSYVNRAEHVRARLTENVAALARFLRHDLRNDLTVALGNLELVDRDPLDTDSLVALATADEAIRTFAQKADRARMLEAFIQHIPADRQIVRLDEVLEEAVEDARERYPDAVITSTAVPPMEVMAGDLLSEVFAVLLENAVEHNPDRAPAVSVCVEETDRSARVAVVDSGPGIPDAQKSLFLDSDESDDHGHAEGLGLFFVRVVVNEWRGRLTFRDRDDGGSIVAVTVTKPTARQRFLEVVPMV